MAHRSFGQAAETPADVEPITFDLSDVTGITCRVAVNGALLIQLVGKVDSGDVSKQSEAILEVFGITVRTDDGENPDKFTGKSFGEHTDHELEQAYEDEVEPGIDPTSSLGRLNEVIHSPDTAISVDELAEMVGWLVEQYTSRPTESANGSRAGGRGTRASSRRKQRRTAGTGAELTSVSDTT
jgi:hypothetical protein